jgi:hypothetical protein
MGLLAFLQSDSSVEESARLRPNLLPGPSSEALLGLNLDPLDQTSSESAAPGVTSGPPNPIRLLRGSDSPDKPLVETGLLADRQSLALSDGPRVGGLRSLSKRRREESRESCISGKGPSRLQFPANLVSSSNPPPGPARSLAGNRGEYVTRQKRGLYECLRGSATLTRMVRPAKD